MNAPAPLDDPGCSVTRFFNQLRAGDPGAAEQLWARFFPRLIALARRTLAGRPQRVADADDAAQSAFASFCLRVKAGEFRVADRADLWNLLGVITARKARKQAARGRREARRWARTQRGRSHTPRRLAAPARRGCGRAAGRRIRFAQRGTARPTRLGVTRVRPLAAARLPQPRDRRSARLH